MNDIAIRCRHLGKRYRLGRRESYSTLRDVITETVAARFRRLRSAVGNGSPTSNGNDSEFGNGQSVISDGTFWALDNVSFDVHRGEVLGLIGRNGAGKSSLLKILSRITKPTRGHAEITGRVGSLLEVGTGFHAELTGRENIYLSGAILGMRRVQIKRQFDEIVAFAEVERFVDTAVKRYSSGMYVRLAFAVASHLETEVLMIDEALAVGDSQFQLKCFTRLRDIGMGGRTVIFVSHNMSAIRNTCSRTLTLDMGRLIDDGETDGVVARYLATITSNVVGDRVVETNSFVVNHVSISSPANSKIRTFDSVEIRVTLTPKVDVDDPGVYVSVLTMASRRLIGLELRDFCKVPGLRAGETCELGFLIDSLPLMPGSFQLEIHLKDMTQFKVEAVPQNYQFQVSETDIYGSRKLDHWSGHVGLRAQAIVQVPWEATVPT